MIRRQSRALLYYDEKGPILLQLWQSGLDIDERSMGAGSKARGQGVCGKDSPGMCCYHQVYVGEKPGPLGYCLLTPGRTLEDEAPSFSEGLKTILTHHWFWNEPPDEDVPGLPPFLEQD